MKTVGFTAILLLLLILNLDCSSSIYRDVYPTLIDGRYDSEFPYRRSSDQLQQIAESVKRISVLAHYRWYFFKRSDQVLLSMINTDFLQQHKQNLQYTNPSTSGTALVVYSRDSKIALLTCAHIISFPDSVVSYYLDEHQKRTEHIRSIAFKEEQLIYLSDIGGGTPLQILANDPIHDLAIIGNRLDRGFALNILPFPYPMGRARELEWGSFVYLFGYPHGYKMITKGIVSNPKGRLDGTFYVDAVLAQGSSGGITLAIRDGVPNFELVGLVKLVPAQNYYVLTPPKTLENAEYDPVELYKGDIVVEQRTDIQYGIVQIISSERIVDFLESNREQLLRRGFNLDSFAAPRQIPSDTLKAR
ncbi:MAG: serine protease [bacterium]